MDDAIMNQSLEQVEGKAWPDPPPDATRLIKSVHSLRRKPISRLSVEDLRIMLGQREGLAVLAPRALDIVEENPLAEGDFYPGDLLVAVLNIPEDYWFENPEAVAQLCTVVENTLELDDLEFHFPPEDDIWVSISRLKRAGIIKSDLNL
ncbi:contact-dependent growth inhibition system immunity protein [Nocardia alni]|uniref:contact-dependent growth inhibition system immunity protein n=1 Tax=Nocardia alni TaxID=2815723 RepID=UPI001C227605|nr:contact-dependent growth inhibition system immunity protein [Nocardia alni]